MSSLGQETKRRTQEMLVQELEANRALDPYPLRNPPPMVSYLEVEHAVNNTVMQLIDNYVFEDMSTKHVLLLTGALRNTGPILQFRAQFWDPSLFVYRPKVTDGQTVIIPLDVRPLAHDYESLNFSMRVTNYVRDGIVSCLERELPSMYQIRMIHRTAQKHGGYEDPDNQEEIRDYALTVCEPIANNQKGAGQAKTVNFNDNVDEKIASIVDNDGVNGVGVAGAPRAPLSVEHALNTAPPTCSSEWNESAFLTGHNGMLMGVLLPEEPKPFEEEEQTDDDESSMSSTTEMENKAVADNDGIKDIVEEKTETDPITGQVTTKVKEVIEDSEGDKAVINAESIENGSNVEIKADIKIHTPAVPIARPVQPFTEKSIKAFNYICSRLPTLLSYSVAVQIVKMYGPNDKKPEGTPPLLVQLPWVVEDVIRDMEKFPQNLQGRSVTLNCRPMFYTKSSDIEILKTQTKYTETKLSLINETDADHNRYTVALANQKERMNYITSLEYLHLQYQTEYDYSREVIPMTHLHTKDGRHGGLLTVRNASILNPGLFSIQITFQETSPAVWVCTDFKIPNEGETLATRCALTQIKEIITRNLTIEFKKNQSLPIRHVQESTIVL